LFFFDRIASVAQTDAAPVWTRSFPIAKEPTTLGQHLKKKRFPAGMRQLKAAQILRVKPHNVSVASVLRARLAGVLAALKSDNF